MKLKYLNCGDIIESKYTHNFVCRKCDSCYVDGGKYYFHFGGKDFSKMLIIFDDGTELLASDEKNYQINMKKGKIKNGSVIL